MTSTSDHYPIGATIMYAGLLPEDNDWLLCDGREFEVQSYPQLFESIGYIYTPENENKSIFNIPNYLGNFLRGASGDTNNDPDRDSRKFINPSTVTAPGTVGSSQAFATKRPNGTGFSAVFDHLPKGDKRTHGVTKGSNVGHNGTPTINQNTCTSGGDSESRPVNVYLNLYIKAK